MIYRRTGGKRGSSLLEFTLVGIPILFVLISVFEISRGMWIYQTMAHAAKEGARFAIVHGKNCGTPNSCLKTVGDVAGVIANAGVGLDPNLVTVSLGSSCGAGQQFCPNVITGTLYDLRTGTESITEFPPDGQNDRNQTIEVSLSFPFRSAIAMFWPGAGGGQNFGVVNLGASSREKIQF